MYFLSRPSITVFSVLSAGSLPSSASFATVTSHARSKRFTALSVEKNANGVPFGEPDKEITCAFFRVINPRTDSYKNFREDVDKGGLDPDLIDGVAWPAINVQKGNWAALGKGASLDTNDLKGLIDGFLSHQDLYWPHKEAMFELLKKREAADGTITVLDIYDGKNFVATDKHDMDLTTASFLEIPLVFLKCGGDPDTGKVLLKSVLEFYNGDPPSSSGRIDKVGVDKVMEILRENEKVVSKTRTLKAMVKTPVQTLRFFKGVLFSKKLLPKFVLGKGEK